MAGGPDADVPEEADMPEVGLPSVVGGVLGDAVSVAAGADVPPVQ